MKEILNFESGSYLIKVEDNTAIVSLPLSIKEFRDVLNTSNNKEEGLIHLAYVVNYCNHGSDANLRGLSHKAKHKSIVENLNLPDDFKQTDAIKKAIKYYNKTYNNTIFGLFKELRRSYEITRISVSIINDSIMDTINVLKDSSVNSVDTAKTAKNLVSELLSDLTKIRNTTTDLSLEINKLKELESELAIIEAQNITPRGATSVPKSALD